MRQAALALCEMEADKALEKGDLEAHMSWGRLYHAATGEHLTQVVAEFDVSAPAAPVRARFCENTLKDFRFCRRPLLHTGPCCP